MLLQHLETSWQVAFLSRGYGRKTKGFLIVHDDADAAQVGDEPLLIARHFPNVKVAVCENRLEGLQRLKNLFPNLQIAILDDAFQHRSLRADFNILLTDCNRPWWNDWVLPTGNLREFASEKHRANIIVATKCAADMNDTLKHEFKSKLKLDEQQRMFFTSIEYCEPIQAHGSKQEWNKTNSAIGFAGIANPQSFKQEIEKQLGVKNFKSFADHHIFSQSEIDSLTLVCDTFGQPIQTWITTEKDMMRLRKLKLPQQISIFYLPIKMRFLEDEKLFFDTIDVQVKKFIQ